MLQTSITKWLSKPKTVTQPDPVPLEPQHPKKPNRSAAAAEQPAKPISNPAADDGDNVTPTAPTPSPAPTALPTHGGSTTASGSAPATRSPPRTITTTTLPPLAPNIVLAPLTSATLPSFRRLNTLLLEIPYPTKFYDEILTDPTTASITLAAFWRNTTTTTTKNPTSHPPGILVAGIRCRLLSPTTLSLPTTATTPSPPQPALYIATLSTLSPYRAHGLASHLLASVTTSAARRHGVVAVCAHVWVANGDGLRWYQRRGFEVLRKEEGYYRRLRPSAAWVVWRRVGVGDLLAGVVGEEGEGGKEEGEGEGVDGAGDGLEEGGKEAE
ncbi:hypothetical protein SLS54_003579 [Diplodia seriata]